MESVFLRFTTTLVSMQCVFFWIVEVAKFAKNMVLRKKYKSIGASFSTRVLITLSIKFLNRENPWEGGDASAILHFKTIEHNVRRLHPWCKSMWVANNSSQNRKKNLDLEEETWEMSRQSRWMISHMWHLTSKACFRSSKKAWNCLNLSVRKAHSKSKGDGGFPKWFFTSRHPQIGFWSGSSSKAAAIIHLRFRQKMCRPHFFFFFFQ